MKTNKQIQNEILKQIKDETFGVYTVENGNFFNECYEFLEINKLKVIPIFSDFSYLLAIVKEDSKLDASSIQRSSKKDTEILDQIIINTRPREKYKM